MTDFKTLELSDKPIFDRALSQDPPQTSELTFTNLFMWRCKYQPSWLEHKGCLLIIMSPADQPPFGLPPVGTGDKLEGLGVLFDELARRSSTARVTRVGEALAQQISASDAFVVTEDRDNSDYVYLAQDLIDLPGNRFHKKKNHVNRFLKTYQFEYRNLDLDLIDCFLRLQEDWCELRNCVEEPDLFEEDRAVYEALTHFEDLDFKGGAILLDSKVEAFSIGEPLNPDTAVIHIEKANPEIPGLYAIINQKFCQECWSEMKYVNREQDLGVAGLRKAKKSYHPDHMVDKYIVTPRM